tara:strand:- start:107 stop:856 length:750 start_codon:yes stop_codon:yes gene_type:complete
MKEINLRHRKIIDPIPWTPYTGETVVIKITIRGGQKIQETAFFEDRVNAVPQGNAYIIGNGPSRKDFDLKQLKSTGQTYGCNALYRDFMPDYLFSVDRFISEQIVKDKVYEKCVCYAPSLEVNRSAKSLNLIPNNPHWISGNAAMWTSLVHGHKNLFLLGMDFREYGKNQLNNIYQDTDFYGQRNNNEVFEGWLLQFRTMIKQRPYCHFTVVHDDPPEYMHHLQTGTDLGNTSLMTYAEFKAKVLNQAD